MEAEAGLRSRNHGVEGFHQDSESKKDTPLQIPASFAKKAIETLQCKKSQIFE